MECGHTGSSEHLRVNLAQQQRQGGGRGVVQCEGRECSSLTHRKVDQ